MTSKEKLFMYKRLSEKMETDVLVIGLGLAGVCAAVTAARQGCSVIALERFRTLGGNGGPDVGVHPSGAHRFHPYAAETGVIEEMIEEAAWKRAKTLTYDHHYNISQLWDGILCETMEKAGVQVLRCHYAKEPVVENGKITKVIVEDIATYHTREISVNVAVIDSSGDGNVSASAGAEFCVGREAKSTYGERSAPEKADNITLGTSIVGYVRRSDKPVEFIPPDGTPPYHPGYEHSATRLSPVGEAILVYPTETGGENSSDTIEDDHEIYKTLLDQLYAWWNRGKKEFPENENWELVWVSPRTAKRESRRFIGEYTLTQNDVEQGKIFPDAIGFGGFAEDLHYPRPENDKYIEIKYIAIPPIYTIPYRCIYSKDINNLFFASRLCSVSHLAHGTVRLQRTLSTIGMAVGTAAGLCKKYACQPRDIYNEHMSELQQILLKEDITIPGIANQDDDDIARTAEITADSFVPFGVPETEDFLPLDRVRGVMLWDWRERLDSFSCYLKNENNNAVTLKAILRLFSPKVKYKENNQNKKFKYFNKHNHMEWGVDDTRECFEIVKQVEFTLPAGFKGWHNVRFDTELVQKDPYNDDVRYMVEISAADGVFWSVSNKSYDFCRRAEWQEGQNDYITYYDGHSFNISPQPLYGEPQNIIDGVSRRWSTNPVHMWIAAEKGPQSIILNWKKPVKVNHLSITFDSLSRTFHKMPLDCEERVSGLLAKHYTVEANVAGEWKKVYEKNDNYHRFNKIDIKTVETDKLRVTVLESWGKGNARIYEIRAYNKNCK